MIVGDLVKYRRTGNWRSRSSSKPEPLGLIIETWKPRFEPDHSKIRKCLVEWFIHPGQPGWYRCEELVVVSSAE